MRLVLIAEARADAVSAGRLADRVLIECGPDWMTADTIEDFRSWTGFDADTLFTAWHDLRQHTKAHSVMIHGRNRGPDHTAARLALALAVVFAKETQIDAVVLIREYGGGLPLADHPDSEHFRDMLGLDNQPKRRTRLEEARKDMAPNLGFPTLIGTANPEREAWILNGFVARSDSENRRLEQVTNRLGFDPTRQPHRLRGDRRRSDQVAERDIRKEGTGGAGSFGFGSGAGLSAGHTT